MSQTSVPQEGGPKLSRRSNQRATIRYRCAPATIGKVFMSDDQEFQRACIINLSLKGIGLQLARRLELGQFILVSMRSNDGTQVYEVSAQVAHCSLLPHGDWYVGCELTLALTHDDLDQLL